jgi:integrase
MFCHMKRGRKKVHPRDKPGWKPNPFGKHMGQSSAKKYLEATKHCYAIVTQKARARRLKMIIRDLRSLGVPGFPKRIKEEHILTYLEWLVKKPMKARTKTRLLRSLDEYLSFYENNVFRLMEARKMIKFATDAPSEIRNLPEDAIEKIHAATESMEGWRGDVARFITMAYPYTGLRPSELRKVALVDVNLADWTIAVKHPKGEMTYGRQRRVGIPEGPARDAFARFLEARRSYLTGIGLPVNAEPLVPYYAKGRLDYWHPGYFNALKCEVEQRAGIRFKLKDYRSSYCQLAIDKGAPLEAVSQVMGHSTTKTTESYYARMRDSHAFSLVENAWALKPIASIEPAIRENPCQSMPVQKKPELNFSQ